MQLRITEEYEKFSVEELTSWGTAWRILRSFDFYDDAKEYAEWYSHIITSQTKKILWQGKKFRAIDLGFKFIIQKKSSLLLRLFGEWEEFDYYFKEYGYPDEKTIKMIVEKTQNLEKYGTPKKVLWMSKK